MKDLLDIHQYRDMFGTVPRVVFTPAPGVTTNSLANPGRSHKALRQFSELTREYLGTVVVHAQLKTVWTSSTNIEES